MGTEQNFHVHKKGSVFFPDFPPSVLDLHSPPHYSCEFPIPQEQHLEGILGCSRRKRFPSMETLHMDIDHCIITRTFILEGATKT